MSQDSSSSSKPGKASPTKVDPKVKAKPEPRQFSAEYKRRILEEADACTEASQIGALLRREGLYSSNLTQQNFLLIVGGALSLISTRVPQIAAGATKLLTRVGAVA
jgi:hypothetical protein